MKKIYFFKFSFFKTQNLKHIKKNKNKITKTSLKNPYKN